MTVKHISSGNWSRVGAVVVMLATVSLWSASPSHASGDPTTVHIAQAIYPSTPQMAQGEGYVDKYFRQVNATAKWSTFNSGVALSTAFLAGDVDLLTSVTAVPMVPLAAKGFVFKVIWVTDSSINDDEIVAKSSIHSMKDLVGKKVTYTTGTGQQYSFLTAARLAGLAAGSYTNIDLPAADGAAAILSGQVDAADLYQPYADKVAHTKGFHLLPGTTDAALTKATNGAYRVADFVAVKPSYAQSHAAIVKAFIRAMRDAAAFYLKHPAKAAKLSWKQMGAPSPSQALALLKTSSYPTLKQQLSNGFLGKPGHPGAMASVIYNISKFEVTTGAVKQPLTLAQTRAMLYPAPALAVSRGK